MRNLQGSTVGSYFDDRLNVIAGIGYYLYKQYQKDIASVGANGQPTSIAYSAPSRRRSPTFAAQSAPSISLP